MGESKLKIRQTTIMLPDCDYGVPVLSADDDTSHIPVTAICEMLGLYMLCGICIVCYSTGETETSLHLLPGRFL